MWPKRYKRAFLIKSRSPRGGKAAQMDSKRRTRGDWTGEPSNDWALPRQRKALRFAEP
jgi:hypothetical protein